MSATGVIIWFTPLAWVLVFIAGRFYERRARRRAAERYARVLEAYRLRRVVVAVAGDDVAEGEIVTLDAAGVARRC